MRIAMIRLRNLSGPNKTMLGRPGVRQFGALILEKVHVFNSLRVSWGVVVMARFGTFCIDLAV